MDLRSGISAERRRRVLREDAGSGEAESTTPRRKTRVRIDAAHYPEAAQPHRQPRIADLIPSKMWSVAAVAGTGSTLIAGILAGFAYLKPLASTLGEEALRPVDLTRPGNLADWLASWTLLGTALVAWVIYSLRRHRADDYRGRYRAWLWTAPAFALGAIDAAAGIHQTIAGGAVALTGLAICGNGAFWWILFEGLLLVAVSAALVREFLRCRISLAILSLAVLSFAVAAATTVYRIDVAASQTVWIVQEGFRLFGHFFLSFSVLLYARHVLREVQGMTKAAKRKRKPADDESRVPAPHFRKKASSAKEKASERAAASTPAASKPVAPPTPVAARPAIANPVSSTKPATPAPAPSRAEPPRTAPASSVGAKPSGNDARSSDVRPGEVRRIDSPAKAPGPLASKLRPAAVPVAKPASPSTSDDDEDDDDRSRHSRKQKKRR